MTTPEITGTNAEIVDLVKAGVKEPTIISFVKGYAGRFDLSAKQIVALTKAGVSETIIDAMLAKNALSVSPAMVTNAPAPPVSGAAPVTATIPDLLKQPREPGIYLLEKDKLEQLEPTVATSAGVGAGTLMKSGLTMGIKKVKVKAAIRGAQASLRVDEQAEFYFFGSSFNPNEFVLGKLESNDNKREIIVGQAGLMGAKSGLRDDDQVTVSITKLESGVYKVVPSRALTPGEYGFINVADSKTPRLWDFGVDR